MVQFILNTSIILLVIIFFTYVAYCFGLFAVLAKIKGRKWFAFIPMLNFRELILSLGLPKKWFLYSIVPYFGTIYSVAVAERLGKVFGKNFVFSTFWLTVGAPVGMNILAKSKISPKFDEINSPTPSIKNVADRLKKLRSKKKDRKFDKI